MRKFQYKYHVDEEKGVVVALSTFAKRPVRGVARCDPKDTFDVETGKKLAGARCNVKVAEKRVQRATQCVEELTEAVAFFEAALANAHTYLEKSTFELAAAEDTLANLVDSL